MLTQTGRYWKFESQAKLDEFLNECMDSNDKYELSFGISSRGEWYAYGNIEYRTKFGTKAQQQQAAEEERKKVTTF